MIVDNIENHRFPHDVHQTTGPSAYTLAINQCLQNNSEIPHRIFDGIEFRGFLKFKYKLGKFFLYYKKSEHWKRKQNLIDIITPE